MNRFFRLVFTLLTACLFVPAACVLASPNEVKIYVSPQGADDNEGTSLSRPVKTLERMKSLIKDSVDKGIEKINVELAAGVYEGESLLWDFPAPRAEIHVSGPQRGEGDAIFDGKNATGNFWTVRIESSSQEPIQTNLSISNITVQNYCEGISLGDFRSKALIEGNRLENIVFKNIGTKYESERVKNKGKCVAALRLQGALHTALNGLKFSNIENLPQLETEAKAYGPLALHAIYIADRSSNVLISDSEFELFTGSPIRLRNRSDDVTIVRCKFNNPIHINEKADQLAAVSQWNCTTTNPACARTPKDDECPSRNIYIRQANVGGRLKVYEDETLQRGDPTCKDEQRLQGYRSFREGYVLRVE